MSFVRCRELALPRSCMLHLVELLGTARPYITYYLFEFFEEFELMLN